MDSILAKFVSIAFIQLFPSSTHFISSFSSHISLKKLKITSSEPGVKGDTVSGATKPAELETGVSVQVPLFVNEGETIKVDTRDESYVGRAK